MNVAYFTLGGRSTGSSRIRAWKVADALVALGHTVSVNDLSHEAEVVIVQKRHDMIPAMDAARAKGVRVILDVDDWVATLPFAHADVITIDEPMKRALYADAVVIPGCLDVEPDGPQKTEHAIALRTVVTVCSVENVYHVAECARAAEALGIRLVVVTNTAHPRFDAARQLANTGRLTEYVNWDLETVDHILVQGDLFVAPLLFGGGPRSDDWVRSKCANRIRKARALGLPVAATPIPAYVADGLTWAAETSAEWTDVLARASDREGRKRAAAEGHAFVQQFAAHEVVKQWLRVFHQQ